MGYVQNQRPSLGTRAIPENVLMKRNPEHRAPGFFDDCEFFRPSGKWNGGSLWQIGERLRPFTHTLNDGNVVRFYLYERTFNMWRD